MLKNLDKDVIEVLAVLATVFFYISSFIILAVLIHPLFPVIITAISTGYFLYRVYREKFHKMDG
jgi:hypothetical protein